LRPEAALGEFGAPAARLERPISIKRSNREFDNPQLLPHFQIWKLEKFRLVRRSLAKAATEDYVTAIGTKTKAWIGQFTSPSDSALADNSTRYFTSLARCHSVLLAKRLERCPCRLCPPSLHVVQPLADCRDCFLSLHTGCGFDKFLVGARILDDNLRLAVDREYHWFAGLVQAIQIHGCLPLEIGEGVDALFEVQHEFSFALNSMRI